MKINDLLARLMGKRIGKHFSYNLTASLLNQIRWFFLVWTATQLLSVGEYGIFTLLVTLIMTAIDLSDLGINASTTRFVAQYHQHRQKENMLMAIWYATSRKCRNAVLIAIILVVGAKPISNLLFLTEDWSYLVAIAASGVVFGLLNGLSTAIYQGKQDFHRIFQIAVYLFVITMVLVFVAYVCHYLSLEGFIWLHILILGISVVFSGWFLRKDIRDSFAYRSQVSRIKGEFNQFGKWMFLWAVFCVLQSRIDLVMLAQMTSTVQVAYYDLAMKYTRPLMMVFSAYGQVLNPLMAGYRNKAELLSYVKQTYSFLWKLSVGLILMIFLAKPLVLLIVGEAYSNSVLPLQIVLAALIFFCWTMPFNTAIYALKKPYVFTIETIVGLLITVVGNYLLLGAYGATGAAMTFAIVQLVSWGIAYGFYLLIMRRGAE